MTVQDNTKNGKNLSVAKVIMAILWQHKIGTVKFFRNHDYFKIFCHDKSKKTILSSVSRLKKQKLVETRGRYNIILTPAGAKKALEAFIEAESILHAQKKHRWDGGWRIIFFDIPEKQRKTRDYLRRIIRRIGFKELQRSIWIYPGQVPMFLRHILARDDIKEYVRFIITEHIDDDKDLRKKFNIKLA